MPIGFPGLQPFGSRLQLKQAKTNQPPNLQVTHASDEFRAPGKSTQQDSPLAQLEPRRLFSRLWQAVLSPVRWPLVRLGLLSPQKERVVTISFPVNRMPVQQGKLAGKNPFATQPGTLVQPKSISAPEEGPRFGRASNPFASMPVREPIAASAPERNLATKPPHEEQQLWDAVRAGDVNAVREFIANGMDVNIRQANGKTPLHQAVARGNLPMVQTLLEAPKIQADAADDRGTRPIHLAVELGHDQVAQRLLHHGIEVNGQSGQGYTPLYWAARRGHQDLVNTLLTHGADVSMPNQFGETSLHGAARGGHVPVMQALLNARNADPNVADHNGVTPLHLAARKDHIVALDLLTACGGDLQRADHNGETPQSILDKRRQIRAHRESD
jgi:ankyrin repeat protein